MGKCKNLIWKFDLLVKQTSTELLYQSIFSAVLMNSLRICCLFFVAVLMAEGTITTPTQWSEAVTESSRWTFMFQVCIT